MTDLIFIFLFLPATLLMYWVCSPKIRNYVLLIFNIVFYAGISTGFLPVFFISVVINLLILKIVICISNSFFRKVLLALGIASNLIPLIYFKYADFGAGIWEQVTEIDLNSFSQMAVPIGISFYTFKAISLLIDAYKGKEISGVITVVVYLTFFGQIISGPISRVEDFGKSYRAVLALKGNGNPIFEGISSGLVRFSIGLCKKILIANVLENIVSEIFSDVATVSSYEPAILWLGSICYSLQLFVDFSGYSDMAIGVSTMFGFECPENFDYPYTTKSISEFWRRWHISLGAWFRDYVYIPSGGRNAGKIRVFRNLMVVWLLTGIWHGVNWTFIVWGISYGLLVSFEKFSGMTKRLNNIGVWIYRILSLLIINFEWVIFKSESLAYACTYIKGMFGLGGSTGIERAAFLLKDYLPFVIAALICCLPVSEWCKRRINGKRPAILIEVVCKTVLFVFAVVSVAFIIAGANNPFAYANF